jgi:hypothetical protein
MAPIMPAHQRLRGSRLWLGSGEVCDARTFFQSGGETGSGSCDGGIFLWGRKAFIGSSTRICLTKTCKMQRLRCTSLQPI